MKKIKLFTYYFIAASFVFSSCSAEDEVVNIDPKTESYDEYEETAFARCDEESMCFIDDGFNRWGWSNGPYKDRFGFALYAAAGQCDIEKGERVGQVSFRYDHVAKTGTVRYVTYAPYVMQETHLYVGAEKYPLTKKGEETVAPGQYPFKHTGLNGTNVDVHYLENIPDPGTGFYIIAHAVVTK